MNPVDFPQSNRMLLPPPGQEETVEEMRVYACEEAIISCWQPTEADRAAIAAGLPVYLWVFSGHHPPVAIATEDPFVTVQS